MKKNVLPIIVFLFYSMHLLAQVGINNINPKATLDVVAKTIDGTRPEGIIAPRLTGDQIQAGDTQYTTEQKGTILYVTSPVTVPSSKTANINAEGFYFFDGNTWQKIVASSAVENSWSNDATNSLAKLTTKADGTPRAAGTEFVVKDNGAVGIGVASPTSSAILDINSSDKGIMIPRVALTSTTDTTTILSPTVGLMAYNTGVSGLSFKGFVFWNGTEWRQLDNSTTINPVITGLNCNTASISPASFTSGTPYAGTLTVYYTSGNGGSYPGGTSFTQNGLTFTLDPGSLNKGNGAITYSVSGTPNFSSPTTITIPISFLGFSCNATVGINTTPFAIGEIRSARITVPASTFTANGGSRNMMSGKDVANITTTNRRSAFEEASSDQKAKFIYLNGGTLRMDFMESNTNGDTSPKFYNASAGTIIFSISALSTNDKYIDGVSTEIASSYYSYRIDGDDNFSTANGEQAEYVNAMVSFPNGEWYNCTWHATKDTTNYYFYFTAQRLN